MYILNSVFLGYSYIIYRFIHDGVLLFTGLNDGIEQMIPIQMFLFDKWSVGNLYATDFGLGEIFTDLSYYFSTNILFIINVTCIILLNIYSINTQSIYWMVNALVISTIKSMYVLYPSYSNLFHVILGLVLLWHFYLLCRRFYYRFYCLLAIL